MNLCALAVSNLVPFSQAELADVKRELKEVNFKEEVLKREKQLLVQFANHVSMIHSVKVQRFALLSYIE